MAQLKNTNVDDTGFIKLPTGSTAQRPSGAAGQLRYNSTTSKVETYNGELSDWAPVDNEGVVGSGGNSVFEIDSEGTTYRVHAFTSDGTFTVERSGEIEYLIIAGGGAGSGNYYDDGGGGGAGGLIQGTTAVTAQNYSITIGQGGNWPSGAGANTTAFGLTALGGGGGGGHRFSGNAGGSGGGGTGYYGNDSRPYEGGAATQPGSASGGLGNPGGGYAAGEFGGTVLYPQSSGGGGAGSPGFRPVNNSEPGDGGSGIQNTIAGAPYYWAGGGAGVRSGKGGLGGGADASYGRGGSPARPGAPNTGGGGGGGRASGDSGSPSNGGAGIVLVRYPVRPGHPDSAVKATALDAVIDYDFSRLSTYTGIGSVIYDARGGVIGNLANSPRLYDKGTHRGAMSFNGSSQYIQVDEFANRPTTQLTLEGWVWPNRAVTTGTRRGAFWSNSASTYLGIFNSNDGGSTHGLHWALQTSNSRTGSNNGSIPNQQWSHIVGTYDGSRTKGYINGELVYDVAQSGTVNDGTWYCGVYGGAVNDGTHNWEGEMSQLRMYNRALTQQEIQDIYNANRWRFGL